jgi:hypothetical protein
MLTADENPLMEETMIFTFPLPPWGTAIELAEDESEKLGWEACEIVIVNVTE